MSKVYGFCKAGCKYPVVKEEDFIKTANSIPLESVNGTYHLELLKRYRIYQDVNETQWEFSITVYVTEELMEEGEVFTETYSQVITLPEFVPYSDKVDFRLISVNWVDNGEPGCYIYYDWNGERKSYYFYDQLWRTSYKSIYATVTGNPNKVLLLNEDGTVTLKADKLFVAYADDLSGTNMSFVSLGKEYMGTYSGQERSEDPSDYSWIKVKGEKGDATKEDIDRLEESIDTTDEDVADLNGKVTELTNDVSVVKIDVKHLQEKVSDMEVNIELECDHTTEITGVTGYEAGFAIEDQQMKMNKIQGQSLILNQLVKYSQFQNQTVNGVTFTNNNDGSVTVKGTASANISYLAGITPTIKEHKYLGKSFIKGTFESSNFVQFTFLNESGTATGLKEKGNGIIFTVGTSSSNHYNYIAISSGETVDATITMQLFDLTQMFGANAEKIKTADDFYTKVNLGGEVLPYMKGIFVNSGGNVISTGRNLWDEEWEIGAYDSEFTGEKIENANNIRSKNFITVIPNKEYYFKVEDNNFYCVCQYDINKNYIGSASAVGGKESFIFETTGNTYYITFDVINKTTYKNSICINVSDTSFNGTYEPYKEEKITNIGELKQHDYIDNLRSKKVYATELYTITNNISFGYNVDGNYKSFYVQNTNTNFKYLSNTTTYIDKFINTSPYINYVYAQKNGVIIIQTNKDYATKAEFLADMVGVQIMSESATPIEEDIDLQDAINVYKGGMQIQDGNVPFIISKQYSVRLQTQIQDNVSEVNELKERIATLEAAIVNLTSGGGE